MIKIGVSSCFMYPDPNRPFFSPKKLCYLENDMANYLYREEAMPILIPSLTGKALDKFLDQMDGFVFQGGSDLCPETYGDDYLNRERWPGDAERDQYELKIADYAFKNKKPILGICRGAQLLNVYFGGKLYQDLQTELKQALKHRDASEYDKVYHSIEFIQGKLLDKIYQNEKNARNVNSVHHQGIKVLGNNLVIEAISPKDQLIEAFSYQNPEENYVLAVQWHPEFSHTIKDKVISADLIYNHFLDAIKLRRE